MLSSSSRWHRAMPWRRHPGLSPPCLLCLWYPFRGGELCPRKCGRVSGSLAASLVTSRKFVHPTGANYPLSICVNHIQHRYGSKIRTQGDSIEYNSRLNHIFSALSIHFFCTQWLEQFPYVTNKTNILSAWNFLRSLCISLTRSFVHWTSAPVWDLLMSQFLWKGPISLHRDFCERTNGFEQNTPFSDYVVSQS